MKNNEFKLGHDDIFFLILMSVTIVFFIFIGWFAWKDYKVSQEVIKYSEEYTKYDKCTEIQGKYYCK